MNEYRLECLDCEDESIVTTGSDIPAYCPLCGSDDIQVVKRELVLEDLELWEDDE